MFWVLVFFSPIEVYGTLSLDRLLQVPFYIWYKFGFGVNTIVNTRVWLG